MLRTDHRYPPTAHMPLPPMSVDHHFEAITVPAQLPTIERLTPSSRACGADACNQGRGVPCTAGCGIKRLTEDDLRELQRMIEQRQRPPEVPSFRLWLAGALGAAAFAVGYLLGGFLP